MGEYLYLIIFYTIHDENIHYQYVNLLAENSHVHCINIEMELYNVVKNILEFFFSHVTRRCYCTKSFQRCSY